MATISTWRNPRPVLTIELRPGHGNSFTVTSTRALTVADLDGLRDLGLLGYGQEREYLHRTERGLCESVASSEAAPTGRDTVPCVELDRRTGEVVRSPAINEYTGEPIEPHVESYWIYEVHNHVDSSD